MTFYKNGVRLDTMKNKPIPKWIVTATKNIQAYNKTVSPEEKKRLSSEGGKKSWANLTIDEKAKRLAKMRAGRK